MARIVLSLKIFPADIDINLETLKEKIKNSLPSYASVYKFEEEPIAFGLVAVIAHIVFPENQAGGLDEVEESIKNVSEVNDIQTIMIRRA
ncbi:MAG: elongation factor 1-beta [Candidatus Bathyarchaeia archaeon]|nr:elongation factor 1-beta [Candidatus Bathyarchaeota archaeon]